MAGLLDAPVERDPNYEYGSILPFRKGKDGVEWGLLYSDAVKGAVDAFTAPGRALKGQEMAPQDAFDFTLNMAGGGMAAKRPAGSLGTFGGVNSKIADKAKLLTAQTLEQGGATANEIWDKTGWFRGPDKQWRFEIDDSQAKMKFPGLKQMYSAIMGRPFSSSVMDAMDHPELAKAYPKLGQIPLTVNPQAIPGTGGMSSYGNGVHMMDAAGSRLGRVNKDLTLHEGQHAIQDYEGFAKGGASRDMEYADLKPHQQQALNALYDQSIALKKAGNNVEAAKVTDTINRMITKYQRDAYKRLAGEVEARTVERRMNMTPEQRRASFPLDMMYQDTPLNQMIFKY